MYYLLSVFIRLLFFCFKTLLSFFVFYYYPCICCSIIHPTRHTHTNVVTCSKYTSMLQVSSPVAATPYSYGSYGLPKPSGGRRNCKLQLATKSDPQQVSQQIRANHTDKKGVQQRKSLSSRSPPNMTKSNYGQRFPFQELQYSFATASDLFAGSKSTVTPSPSELPLPPISWTENLKRKNAESVTKPKDLITSGFVHDSAIILSGPKLMA